MGGATMIRTRQRQIAHKSSMLTLALLVLGGAVITTLAQASDDAGPRAASPAYLHPESYRPATAPSRHIWLLPAKVQGRFEGGQYNIYFQDDASEHPSHVAEEPEARMSLGLGDPRAAQVGFQDVHYRAMMSDRERNRYHSNEPVISMSVGRSW